LQHWSTPCNALHGNPWQSMAIHGNPWIWNMPWYVLPCSVASVASQATTTWPAWWDAGRCEGRMTSAFAAKFETKKRISVPWDRFRMRQIDVGTSTLQGYVAQLTSQHRSLSWSSIGRLLKNLLSTFEHTSAREQTMPVWCIFHGATWGLPSPSINFCIDMHA
jgi:hypothetical protein